MFKLTRFAILTLFLLPMHADAWVPSPVKAQRGIVAADHPLASKAGVEILKRGGNAVDAACATAFALGVVNPAGSGIGGGGFMLVKLPNQAAPTVVDFRETAPAKASADMYQKPGLPKRASRYGGLAIGVPGEVAGCAEAIKRFGKLKLRQVLAPAIRLARKGFPVGEHLAHGLKRRQKRLASYAALASMFQRGGKVLQEGQRAKRPKLARTLATIARKGAKAFYRGAIAKDIVASAKAAGGILELDDLANYKVKIRTPLKTTFRGHDIYLMPPPSSGGTTIITVLNILRRYRLAAKGHNSSAYLYLLTEAMKHAFADRARYLGDTDFVKVPVAHLVSQAYADSLARRISKRAGKIMSYGSPRKPKAAHRDSGTSHLSVIDQQGMAVALTTSINTGFGSLVVGKRSGIILNNTMDDFSANPGKPNAFGLTQSVENAIAPGKRPLSSMSPTIVTKDGKVVLAVGGSGGPTIITGTLQALLNVLEFKLDVAQAVSLPRIHHQWLPNKVWTESDLPRDVTDKLAARGQKIRLMKHPFTAVQATRATYEKGARKLSAASDPRKHGWPAGH